MVFIDLRNMIRCGKTINGINLKVDFDSMIEELVGERNLVAKYVFDGISVGTDGSIPFHDRLRHMGFRVIAREQSEMADHIQKEVDVAMACEMLAHAMNDNFDTAIIISGDRDFRPAIEFIQRQGKRAEVAGFSNGMSGVLSRSGDLFRCLDSLPIYYYDESSEVSDAVFEIEPIEV